MNDRISCEWTYSETVNYAMQQNHVPIVKRIVLTNRTSGDIRGLTVRLTAEPEFAYEWSSAYDLLPAGQSVDLGTVRLQLSAAYLGGLSERMTGMLKLSVLQGQSPVYETSVPMAVLAFDEWSGLAVMPEMAAAFVTPNHPQVSQVVREAADILGKWSGSPSFTGYQSKDPNRAKIQAAAVYAALQNRGVAYSVAPPSFEQIGQRVRLPETVFAHRMGNCLDLSLLYAACLEAVGLHPLLVFVEKHAFVGLWLVEETFPESVQDDMSLLTKRIAPGIHEICVIESTAFVEGSAARFEEAVSMAAARLADPAKFDCVVDIRRARAGAIRPLPVRVATPQGWEIDSQAPGQPLPETAAPELFDVVGRPVEAESIPITRQKLWERRLLDLSLRNALINFRLSKSSVPLMAVQLADLEDALAEREEFQLMAKPGDWQDDGRSPELYQTIGTGHPLAALLKEEFTKKRLRADLSPPELDKRLVHLYRSARVSLEENGANTLYLALGLLKWYESPVSEMPRRAPIVLVPVDILKKSSRAGYVIRVRDEEPQANITLLEMLRQDYGIGIGGLDPLPKDANGIDLKQIFGAFRHALMQMTRWDVEETAYLGLFSFGQFVMWNDIRTRSGELAQNDIVASLMDGRLKGLREPEEGVDAKLDEAHPAALPVPVSADSSQLAAIRAAAEGCSFVLHGPPGTGKSQTITNMIATALADGKRVLFVAEKMAALTVVQTRLAKIGLDPYCLELHSNKSTKKAVLDQLNTALEAPRTMPPEEWRAQADRLSLLRGELNGYVAALHAKQPFGFSLYEAIAGYERAGMQSDAVRFEPEAIERLTPEIVSLWRDLASQIRAAGEECGNPAGHPWSEARVTAYSQSLKAEVEQALGRYAPTLSDSREALAKASEYIRLDARTCTGEWCERFVRLCDLLLRMPDLKPATLESPQPEEDAKRLKKAAEQGRRRDEARRRVCSVFSAEALRFDAALTLSEWTKTELAWFLPKWFGQNRIVKLLKSFVLPGKSIAKQDVKAHLTGIIRWQEEEKKLQEAGAFASTLLGGDLWDEADGRWDDVEAANEWLLELHALLVASYGPEAPAVRRRFAELLRSGRAEFEARSSLLREASERYRSMKAAEEELFRLLQVDRESLAIAAESDDRFRFMRQKAAVWEASLDTLRNWCAWRKVRDEGAAAGLLPLILPYEQGELANGQLVPAFERGLYKACANFIMEKDERLGSFSGSLFEEKVRRFAETDRAFEELTRREIAARLAARVPHMTQEAAQSSEAGILQRAVRSGGRSISIRRLFEQIPHLLPRLTPCMLMSPISVAQYLDPAGPKFDLVIFDEASQVPTAQAVGALARGRQAVIVGDPKQLPPTSFFSRMNDESEEEHGVSDDLESILDDCLAVGMPQMHLSWHYRSRHESLIAFSNAQYYDNRLMTFPSPDEPVSCVKWNPVEGVYDRGRTKQNRAEGEAVVAEIARRLRDDRLRRHSIGVVTFSSIQQSLIEDLLDEALKREPDLELLLAELPEPIFVKNLENVQGDERDVILFSIGYGPDAAGKVSLNFGPLNRQGGWRRLNVAVSRARREMHVFSTLQAHQLSASRTSAQGVLGLKAFLDYAEKGKQALPAAEAARGISDNADIHRNVAAELKRLGYEADLYVGTSGYRIDLAVKHPGQPGTYKLGVLLDGLMYRNAKTARDRDILRDSVLEQLGWRLHRLWMPDWWDNRGAEIRKIGQALERTEQACAPAAEAAVAGGSRAGGGAAVPAEPGEAGVSGAAGESGGDAERANGGTAADAAGAIRAESEATTGTAAAPTASGGGAAADGAGRPDADVPQAGLPDNAEPYRPCLLDGIAAGTDAFYAPEYTRIICEQIAKVVGEEGPISRGLLAKRVLTAWGISRMGAKLDRHFSELLAKAGLAATTWDGTEFYWPEGIDPERCTTLRVASDEAQRRNAEDLPPEEVANAVRAVLAAQISLPEEDLIKQVVKLLGYVRSGAALDKAARSGIACAITRGFAFADDQGRIVYKG